MTCTVTENNSFYLYSFPWEPFYLYPSLLELFYIYSSSCDTFYMYFSSFLSMFFSLWPFLFPVTLLSCTFLIVTNTLYLCPYDPSTCTVLLVTLFPLSLFHMSRFPCCTTTSFSSDAIFVVCSHTFALFWLRKTAVSV